jgi:hypothetical protein
VRPRFAGISKTGATGLEPAASGATGHFQGRDMRDGRLRIALFIRFLGTGAPYVRLVEPSDFRCSLPVAARLVDLRGGDCNGA